VEPLWQHRLVRAEVDVKKQRIHFYTLRRRARTSSRWSRKPSTCCRRESSRSDIHVVALTQKSSPNGRKTQAYHTPARRKDRPSNPASSAQPAPPSRGEAASSKARTTCRGLRSRLPAN
jgi:hypothetical protein